VQLVLKLVKSASSGTSYCRRRRSRHEKVTFDDGYLGSSLQDLVAFLSELHALRIDLYLRQQGVDTSTPAGKALFQMMCVFAELERAMIREQVKSGLERAKAQGKILRRPRIDPRKEAAILDDLREGKAGIIKLATAHGVSFGTDQGESRPLGLQREELDQGRGP
jgi:DNA invertase Pin-like site-specific DNA recombinase